MVMGGFDPRTHPGRRIVGAKRPVARIVICRLVDEMADCAFGAPIRLQATGCRATLDAISGVTATGVGIGADEDAGKETGMVGWATPESKAAAPNRGVTEPTAVHAR